MMHFLIGHSNRDRFKLYCKRTTKTAAGFSFKHLNKLQSLNFIQKLPGPVFDFTFP